MFFKLCGTSRDRAASTYVCGSRTERIAEESRPRPPTVRVTFLNKV